MRYLLLGEGRLGRGLPTALSPAARPASGRDVIAARRKWAWCGRERGRGPAATMAECSGLQFVSPYAFEAMQKVDVVRLAALSDPELRLLLPCLVRMALCAPADQSQSWAQDKKLILRLLSGVEAVNSIVALLSVDFHALEQDASKEQQLR